MTSFLDIEKALDTHIKSSCPAQLLLKLQLTNKQKAILTAFLGESEVVRAKHTLSSYQVHYEAMMEGATCMQLAQGPNFERLAWRLFRTQYGTCTAYLSLWKIKDEALKPTVAQLSAVTGETPLVIELNGLSTSSIRDKSLIVVTRFHPDVVKFTFSVEHNIPSNNDAVILLLNQCVHQILNPVLSSGLADWCKNPPAVALTACMEDIKSQIQRNRHPGREWLTINPMSLKMSDKESRVCLSLFGKAVVFYEVEGLVHMALCRSKLEVAQLVPTLRSVLLAVFFTEGKNKQLVMTNEYVVAPTVGKIEEQEYLALFLHTQYQAAQKKGYFSS